MAFFSGALDCWQQSVRRQPKLHRWDLNWTSYSNRNRNSMGSNDGNSGSSGNNMAHSNDSSSMAHSSNGSSSKARSSGSSNRDSNRDSNSRDSNHSSSRGNSHSNSRDHNRSSISCWSWPFFRCHVERTSRSWVAQHHQQLHGHQVWGLFPWLPFSLHCIYSCISSRLWSSEDLCISSRPLPSEDLCISLANPLVICIDIAWIHSCLYIGFFSVNLYTSYFLCTSSYISHCI